MRRIASRQNPIVTRFRELARSGRTDGQVLIEGPHLLEEALASGVPIEVAAFSEAESRSRLAGLAEQANAAGAQTIVVTPQVLAAMSPVRQPSGAVAIGRCGPLAVRDVLGRSPQLALIVGDVQDPGNVGAIVRAAEACGASGLITGDGSADAFGWKAIRGSMGSIFRLPVAVRQPLAEAVELARAAGLRLLAAVPRGGTSLPECDLKGPVGILLGGEGAGLSAVIVDRADGRLTIPMQHPVESLNVAVAAALILYEASRQRRHDHVSIR